MGGGEAGGECDDGVAGQEAAVLLFLVLVPNGIKPGFWGPGL